MDLKHALIAKDTMNTISQGGANQAVHLVAALGAALALALESEQSDMVLTVVGRESALVAKDFVLTTHQQR